MVQRFNLIREEMERVEESWNWTFAYAPLPGRSRVKVTAQRKDNPAEVKEMFVSAAVFERLPVESVSQLITILLYSEPKSYTVETATPHSQPILDTYELLRRFYKARVDDLRSQQARWMLLSGRKKNHSTLVSKKPLAR